MPIIDLTSAASAAVPAHQRFDLCIVGSGPSGATIAKELANSGLDVVLLESGGTTRCPQADALNNIENVGRPRANDQWTVRNRIIGGSSHTWGGRCAGFDVIDYEERAWVEGSGWPVSHAEVEPFLERSASHLGLAVGTGFSDQRFWALAGKSPPKREVDPALLLPFFWQFSRDHSESYPFEYMRFGRHLLSLLGEGTLVLGATVLRVLCNGQHSRVEGVEYATPDGAKHILMSRAVVLCAGGIENARILLNSGHKNSNGLGNDRDQVGRYLMDHLRGPVAVFERNKSLRAVRRFGRYNVQGHLFRAGLRLSPEVQRREQLLNCSAWLGELLSPDDPWDALRRLSAKQARLPQDLMLLLRNSLFLTRGAVGYFAAGSGLPRKLQEVTLECMCEQVPDPDSRVTLSEHVDRFGTRLPKINWRSHPNEARTMHRMAELVTMELGRAGLEAPLLADWVKQKEPIPATFIDVAHPTGTTRMSNDASRGVVDVDCQVHGVSGLFAAGSSVFPTAGHCNPTQMIVALSIRLADHLKVKSMPVAPLEVATHVQ